MPRIRFVQTHKATVYEHLTDDAGEPAEVYYDRTFWRGEVYDVGEFADTGAGTVVLEFLALNAYAEIPHGVWQWDSGLYLRLDPRLCSDN